VAPGLISFLIIATGTILDGISYYPGPGLSFNLNTNKKIIKIHL
jgi:hypothetical protein